MKNLIILTLLIFGSYGAYACDICGCGIGGNYIGLLPEFNKRFIGFRYQFSRLSTQLGPDGQRTALTRDERYNSVELWGAWNIGERWRILAIVPYSFNEKYTAGNNLKTSRNGMGDIVLNGYYKILDHSKANSNNKLVVQSLWVGAGVKVPTGKYDLQEQQNSGGTSPNVFQLGTGSVDFTANLMYDVRIQDFGVNMNASYKVNTENKDQYRYGNKFSVNTSAYYKISLGMDMRIAPNIGLAYENQQKDRTMNFKVDETGGSILNGMAGIELNLKKVSIGASYQLPVSQNLGKNRIDAGNKILTHVSFAF